MTSSVASSSARSSSARSSSQAAAPSSGPALDALRASFAPVPGYLNAATLGLPPAPVVAALRGALDDWQAGRSDAAAFDEDVRRARTAYARIAGVAASDVAVGSQASVLVGTVASSLPDGAEVLTVHGDFASVVFPFLVHADRGVTVRQVPLEALASEVRPGTSVVAYSLVQSADGRVADAAAVREAARAVGARTVCDATQAAGWLPLDAGADDVTVCSAYKWLCSPRGTAFLTVRPGAREWLRPTSAGWYAGQDVWSSTYGPNMTLASDARRFDVSPAWHAWVGTAVALELLAAVGTEEIRAWDVALADGLRARLGLAPAGSAIVSLPDPDGALRRALGVAGCAVAGRAGMVRMSFHVWNDEADVDRAADALRAAGRG
ncbi:aminotransferase class V-fold PLP-dependent enzyme [Kineosporia sp. R_H_3]|uniref:aminotransferase class V-fold PLP-dependent enzyme n=1 Tax=Kineosporia sp. R_H_3 TaxID=1961848 RepID=UPI000B4B56E6|nr:aminotransferase class V-fold PLP-dependent enzyme [Kineosporia sp. R_H_3]